jgi:hypothetical protein
MPRLPLLGRLGNRFAEIPPYFMRVISCVPVNKNSKTRIAELPATNANQRFMFEMDYHSLDQMKAPSQLKIHLEYNIDATVPSSN